MKLITVAAAALNQTPMAWEWNRRNILQAIELARKKQVNILCLPELCITGYGCEDAFHSAGVVETAWEVLQELLPHTRGMVVSLGLPISHQHGVFNTACLAADGNILGFVAKRFLAGDGIHYEPRWFKPWPQGVRGELRVGGGSYPIGDLHFDLSGVKIGFEICEDAWVARRPGGDLALQGIDIILNPSASHFAFGKHEVRKRFVLEASRAFGVSYVYSNLLGCESGRAIYDGEALIASGGRLIATGRRLSFQDVVITTAQIDLTQTRTDHARSASFQPSIEDRPAGCVRGAFVLPEQPLLQLAGESGAAWEASAEVKSEEFARAVALGLFDYLRKTKAQGYVVSLSGGADSSAVTCLVWLMVEMGVGELGLQRFQQIFSHVQKLSEAKDAQGLAYRLLTTVYQATKNSSTVTRKAAKAVAEAIGSRHLEFDVSPLVQGYVDLVSKQVGRPLSWEQDDLALQNIQARVRGPGVWLVANERNAILLVTSNRSEAAVGYATMDGDTCGGLCPIGGIDKAFLRQWLVWLQTTGLHGLQPMPVLEQVTRQEPTAELRPQEQAQTDEKDLMPYELLDLVERAAIRDKQNPIDIFQLIRTSQPRRYRDEDLVMWIERFFRLWCRNQWKRERYAPSFHLDDENLDPKTWCRFPILSGQYERELEQMRTYLQIASGVVKEPARVNQPK